MQKKFSVTEIANLDMNTIIQNNFSPKKFNSAVYSQINSLNFKKILHRLNEAMKELDLDDNLEQITTAEQSNIINEENLISYSPCSSASSSVPPDNYDYDEQSLLDKISVLEL